MSSFDNAMESAISFVVDAGLRTTAVLLVTMFMVWLLRSAAASVRRLVWIGGLTTSLLIPCMLAIGPEFRVAILDGDPPLEEVAPVAELDRLVVKQQLPPRAEVASTEAMTNSDTPPNPETTSEDTNGIENAAAASSPANRPATRHRTTQADTQSWAPHWPTLAGTVLLLGFLIQLMRLVAGTVRVHHLVRNASDNTQPDWEADWQDAGATMQVGNNVSLRESPADISPLACGVFSSTVLFPMAARDWERDRRRAVMLHELGHVRQRDVAAILIGQLAATVYFFHPLVWFAVRQLRNDCERACDDLVLNSGHKPTDYARHLAEIARSFSVNRHSSALAMAMSRTSNIESRVKAILDSDIPRRPLSDGSRRAMLAGALLLSVVVAAPRASHSQTETADGPATDGPTSATTITKTTETAKARSQPAPRTDRNNVFTAPIAPESWNVETGENIRWSAKLGSLAYGAPVVSGGRVFVGTNNAGGFVERFPKTKDLGCLLAFDTESGKFLWQYSAEKLPTGRVNDWPARGISASPYVAGDRLWVVTNRSEVVCLDTEGFYDGQDDGPTIDEHQALNEADVVWSFDMINRFGGFPHNHSDCTITSDGQRLFIVVPNGTDETHVSLPAPGAPSFVALDAKTGKVAWTNRDSDGRILHGQWSSAAYGHFSGVAQVICPSGSGWLYGLDASTGKTLWKFDCNPKDSRWILGSVGRRNNLIAMPLIYEGRVYIATGQDPEHGEGNADLWCINPKSRGDVSPALVLRGKIVPNPNSAVVWHFDKTGVEPGQEPKFENFFHRSRCTPVAKDGLLIAVDTAGLVHCFDARTGQRHWTYDLYGPSPSSPIIINDRIYVGDEDGDVAIFALSKELKLVAELTMKESIDTTPTVVDGVLYLSTRSRLFAIKAGATTGNVVTTTKPKKNPKTLSQQISQVAAALKFTNKQDEKLTADRARLQQLRKALQFQLESLQKAASKPSQP